MDDWGRDGRGWNMDWGRMHDGMGWGGWLLMVVLLLLLVGLAIGLVVLLLMRSTSGGGSSATEGRPQPPGAGTAEQVLGERFARGEIDEDEYLRRRSVLRGG